MLLVGTKGQSLAPFRNINQRYHPKGRRREKKALVMTVQTEINLPTCRNSASVCSWFFIPTTCQLLSSKAHTCTVVGCWSKTANTGNRCVPQWHGKPWVRRPHRRVCRAVSTYTDTDLCLAQGLTEGEGVTNINLRPGSQRTQLSFSHVGISQFPLAASINCGPKL